MKFKLPFVGREIDIRMADNNIPGANAGWRPLTDLLDAAGNPISIKKAATLDAVFACIQLYSRTLGALPFGIYEKKGNGRIRAETHPLDELLHYQPNPNMTASVFQQVMEANLKGWGNAYAWIEFDKDWQVKALWPIPAADVWPYKDPKTKRMFYRCMVDNTYKVFEAWQILHLPGLCFDGLMGKSPIAATAETMGLAFNARRFGVSFFANGARPAGVLEHPGALSEDAIANLRTAFESKYSGSQNTGKVMVLEEGMKYTTISIPPEEAQFLESRKFSVTEIARIFAIPPHMIGDLEHATFSNIEAQDINFSKHSILPDLVVWEQEYNRKLLNDESRKKYIGKFNMDGLLRGDTKTRYECYAIGKQWGFLSSNDIRGKEDFNPDANGDKYYVPLNMIEAQLADEYWQSRINQNLGKKGGENNAE
ncbi:MAG: phage portal protein [Acidaminococcaceae bacterium]